MEKACSFDRDGYLSDKDLYEDGLLGKSDVDGELDEFGDDPFSLAVELSYTRYALSKVELKLKEIKSGFTKCDIDSLDFGKNYVQFEVPQSTMDKGFHAGSVMIDFSGVQD